MRLFSVAFALSAFLTWFSIGTANGARLGSISRIIISPNSRREGSRAQSSSAVSTPLLRCGWLRLCPSRHELRHVFHSDRSILSVRLEARSGRSPCWFLLIVRSPIQQEFANDIEFSEVVGPDAFEITSIYCKNLRGFGIAFCHSWALPVRTLLHKAETLGVQLMTINRVLAHCGW